MTHHTECPNCQQHLDIEVPDTGPVLPNVLPQVGPNGTIEPQPVTVHGPVDVRRVQQSVRITIPFDEIFKITVAVCLSLLVLTFLVVFGLMAFGIVLTEL